MSDWRKPAQKKNNGCLLSVLWFFAVIMLYVQYKSFSGDTEKMAFFAIEIIFFVAMFFIFMKSISANRYMVKHKQHIIELGEHLLNSYDLKDFYETRDALTFHLRKISKFESLIDNKNRLSERSSVILKKLKDNEDEHVNSALIRMAANYKSLIRETRTEFSPLFSDQIEIYSNRLSAKNRHEADLCVLILQKYEQVVGKIEEIDGMDGHAFEHWCADLLAKNGFTDVTVTQASGDQGVDIVAVKDGVHYAIQCKCYSSDLGNTPVQEVYAGKEMYSCQVGVVMTNRHFTAGAKQLAEKTRVLLWDRDKLSEMLEQAKQ